MATTVVIILAIHGVSYAWEQELSLLHECVQSRLPG